MNGAAVLDREAAGMTVVLGTFAGEEEVENMTTASILSRPATRSSRRSRPHGIDLAIMRVSLAMLLWARRRAERNIVSSAEQRRALEVQRGIEARERSWQRLASRRF